MAHTHGQSSSHGKNNNSGDSIDEDDEEDAKTSSCTCRSGSALFSLSSLLKDWFPIRSILPGDKLLKCIVQAFENVDMRFCLSRCLLLLLCCHNHFLGSKKLGTIEQGGYTLRIIAT